MNRSSNAPVNAKVGKPRAEGSASGSRLKTPSSSSQPESQLRSREAPPSPAKYLSRVSSESKKKKASKDKKEEKSEKYEYVDNFDDEEETVVESKEEDKAVPEIVRKIILQQRWSGNWSLESLVCFNMFITNFQSQLVNELKPDVVRTALPSTVTTSLDIENYFATGL